MGTMKHQQGKEEDQRQVALDIALRANVLRDCYTHTGFLMEGSADISDAKILGANEFSQGKYKGLFTDITEMDKVIEIVVEENSLRICPECTKKNQ